MNAYVPLAPVYDELTRDVPYERFAAFYGDVFRAYGKKPSMVLDLGCGTGTLTCLMAKKGYEMIGTDASEEMLAVAQEKAYDTKCSVRPLFLCQSMTELDLYGTVEACISSLDSFNYIPPNELPEVLRRLHLFIEPGGVLLFDVHTPEKLEAQDGQVYVDENEHVFCVWRAEYDCKIGAVRYGMDLFLREGDRYARRQEEHVEYAHGADYLKRLLRETGFGKIQVFGDLALREPDEKDGRVFIAAVRE